MSLDSRISLKELANQIGADLHGDPDKEVYLGDIIINFNKIKNKNNKVNFRNEFIKLWIHGLAHLFGYDHKKDKDFYNMTKVEKKFLSFLN